MRIQGLAGHMDLVFFFLMQVVNPPEDFSDFFI